MNPSATSSTNMSTDSTLEAAIMAAASSAASWTRAAYGGAVALFGVSAWTFNGFLAVVATMAAALTALVNWWYRRKDFELAAIRARSEEVERSLRIESMRRAMRQDNKS